MTYRFAITLDSINYTFLRRDSVINRYLMSVIPKRYNGSFHRYERIGISIRLYERLRHEVPDTLVIAYSSITHMTNTVVKSLVGIAYQSSSQVVEINAKRLVGAKKRMEIEVKVYEE